ncbi:MAG: hypothetical protein WD771_07475 [Gemmatimonadaceae bacterium]
MTKTFAIAWLAVFVVWMGGSYLVHGVLLAPGYGEMAELYRPMEESGAYMPYMLGAHAIMAGAFVWVYARGQEAREWLGQGFRFGVTIALLTTVPWYLIYYAVQPLPGMFVVKQIVYDTALVIVLGVMVAFLYRGEKRA